MKRAALALLLAACASEERAHEHARIVQELRPTEVDGGQMWRFEPGDVVLRHDTARIRVHYALEGKHAVPAADDDGGGVPDYVELVAATYEEVFDFYESRGFRLPLGDEAMQGDNGGDGRFDVYLLDFGFSSDGAFTVDGCLSSSPARCIGYAVQENDFAGYGYPSRAIATRILASHELFHAVQAAYDGDQGVIFSEGSAVWASEAFDPSLGDLEGFSRHFLAEPDRSLDVPPPGPVPPFAYGAGLFFRFLEERYDAALMRSLLEHVEDGQGLGDGAADPVWLDQLDRLLARDHGSSFAEAFGDFAVWNLHTGAAADPEVAYSEGASYPPVAIEQAQLPLDVERLRVFHASAQYRAVAPGGRERIHAALAGAEEERADLRLVLAARSGGRVIALEHGGSIGSAEADDVVVAVIHTALGGESRKPGLCVGSEDEVAACVAAREPAPPVADPGPGSDGDDGGGCSSGGGAGALGLLAAALGLAARRPARRSR